MKVLMAGYQAISILRGGPATQLHETARHLPACGVTPALFDPWSPWDASRCDVFHLFAANVGTYHLAREIHALGVPLVVSPIIFSRHSPGYVRRWFSMMRVAQKIGRGFWSDYGFASAICAWSQVVLPNTSAEGTLLKDGLGVDAGKIVVVPNGVEERFENADPDLFRKRYGMRDFILNVGHIGHERKNVLSLIRALGKIDHPAVIIGRVIRGAYGEACVREASGHKHILLIDGLPHDSPLLASAYAACDVFVLPSQFETPGIAALEAGLAGAKIVITPNGGTQEYFGTMAEYVDPRSVDSIREGIVRALQQKKNTDLRDHIRREFLWQRVAEKTVAAYRRVLDGTAR